MKKFIWCISHKSTSKLCAIITVQYNSVIVIIDKIECFNNYEISEEEVKKICTPEYCLAMDK